MLSFSSCAMAAATDRPSRSEARPASARLAGVSQPEEMSRALLGRRTFEWQLLLAAAAALVLTAALFALTRWAFGLISKRRQQIAFGIATPILLFVVFAGVLSAVAYFQPRPISKPTFEWRLIQPTWLSKLPIVLVVSIANVGNMQSTVDGWQPILDLNKSRHRGIPVAVSPDIRVRFNAGTTSAYYLVPGGWLYAKTLEPIAPGDMATGFLIFQFPDLPPDAFSQPTSRLSLTFHDILERPYGLRIKSDQLNRHLPFFPGVIELG